jgi:hypothetical protein
VVHAPEKAAEYAPVAQLEHTEDPALAYVPARHVVHAVAPEFPEMVPAAQFVHIVEACSA